VDGLAPAVEWQDLKDFCAQIGPVAFAKVDKGGPGGPVNLVPHPIQSQMGGKWPMAQSHAQATLPNAGRGMVRYERQEDVATAIMQMNGSYLGSSQIWVQLDETSKDGTRLNVLGLSPSTTWQALKDHFAQVGPVAFSKVDPPAAGGHAPAALDHRGGYQAQAPALAALPASRGVAEVRYETAHGAEQARLRLPGTLVQGMPIIVKADLSSRDHTRVLVFGLSATCPWQELKQIMSAVGPVAHVKVTELAGVPAAPSYPTLAPMMSPMAGARGPSTPLVGEVRFESPEEAQAAMMRVNGTYIGGQKVTVQMDADPRSAGKKIRVYGLQPSFRWQELKDHFSRIAPVAYADISSAGDMSQVGAAAMGRKPQRNQIRSSQGSAGEVRFSNPAAAQAALRELDGSVLLGSQIAVTLDARSHDGTKLLISNLPAGLEWQELKGHFAQCGDVAFAGVFGPGEVWMATAEEAAQAVAQMNGAGIDGQEISVRIDENSPDGRKLIVEQLPPSVQWQELKDLFRATGNVAHAARAK